MMPVLTHQQTKPKRLGALSQLFICMLLCATGFTGSTHAEVHSVTQSSTVKILTNNWTSQIVLSHVTGQLLQQLGYKVQYLETDVAEQWGALAHGAADIQIEVWEGTMADAFDRLVKSGKMLDAGTHDAKTREDWWYPEYVEKICPGLPDWQALSKCSTLFSKNGMSGPGIYVAGPWEKPDEARIRALGMNFVVNVVEKGDDLWVALKEAKANQKPIVLFNWTPNWVESVYAGKFIEFPTHHPDCETNPKWGVNPNRVYDCGNPKGGWLKKAVSKRLKRDAACAYQFVRNTNFNNAQIARAAAYVDVESMGYEDAARRWIKDNKATWENWIPSKCSP